MLPRRGGPAKKKRHASDFLLLCTRFEQAVGALLYSRRGGNIAQSMLNVSIKRELLLLKILREEYNARVGGSGNAHNGFSLCRYDLAILARTAPREKLTIFRISAVALF